MPEPGAARIFADLYSSEHRVEGAADGVTTYVAARFFIQTITHLGTMTVQVADDQESAEEIFKIVHRFWENLPEGMKTFQPAYFGFMIALKTI